MVPPAPNRTQDTTWSKFIKNHQDVLAACDFFTTEVITPAGLITYYVLFFIHINSRKVHIAGITPNPNEEWMKQIARNITMADWGFLSKCKYLIHDRDTKFCESFCAIIRSGGVKPVKIPPRSPTLNAFAERLILSSKSECLSGLIFFGEMRLLKALSEYIFDFLGTDDPRREAELERKLIDHIEAFLRESGSVCFRPRFRENA